MRYKDATAFRAALEARLNRMATQAGPGELARLRRMVAFDRLLARLVVVAPDRWAVKGGVALDLRLGECARLTRDLDLIRYDTVEAAQEDLVAAVTLALGDFFMFAIERPSTLSAVEEIAVLRYQLSASLAERRFERIRIDVGLGKPFHIPSDRIRLPGLLTFADFLPAEIPAIPLELHLAERVHAYVRIYAEARPSTRVKDLIDIVLLRSASAFEAGRIREALAFTFQSGINATIPTVLPLPPAEWTTTYRMLADEVGLEPDIAVGFRAAEVFLNPLLNGDIHDAGRWNPELGEWRLHEDE